jgi:hypothetical protein
MWLVAVITVSFIWNSIACVLNVVLWLLAVITDSCVQNFTACGSNDFMCFWWPWLESVGSGIVLHVGRVLQWLLMDQLSDYTRMLYLIEYYVTGLPCLYSSFPIIHSQRKLSNNSFISSPCQRTLYDFWFCCSKYALYIKFRVAKCVLWFLLYERETSSVVLQEKRIWEQGVVGGIRV